MRGSGYSNSSRPCLRSTKRGNHVHRAGAIECIKRDQVLEAVGLGLFQRTAHARGFELEHRTGIAVGEDVAIDAGIVQRDRRDVHWRQPGACVALVDRLHRPVDDGQRAQAQEVELHQADGFHVVLVELGHRIAAAAAFVVFGEQRAEVRQRGRRDHHAAGVLAGVAGQVLELARQVDQVAHVVFVAVAVDQLLRQPFRSCLRPCASFRVTPRVSGISLATPSTRPYGKPSTRPASRTTALAAMVP